MEEEKTYYKAKATYKTESIYGTKSTRTITSPMLNSIEEVYAWIKTNKRAAIVHGMGDIDYPKMSQCRVYKICEKQMDFNLDEF